jgi:hypothetical protein
MCQLFGVYKHDVYANCLGATARRGPASSALAPVLKTPSEQGSLNELEPPLEEWPSPEGDSHYVQHLPDAPINTQRALRSTRTNTTLDHSSMPLNAKNEARLQPDDAEARTEPEIIDLGSSTDEDSDIEMLEAA